MGAIDPFPGGGDNLYLSSILALDPDTGRLKWHYQTTPADNWDYTATQHMILADLVIDGRTRKVLMQAPKNGFFYVLDRVTGELISADKYIPATWATHVDMKTGRPVETPEADWSQKTQLIIPAAFGGHNWHPMAFNPQTGLVYIPAMQPTGIYPPAREYLETKQVHSAATCSGTRASTGTTTSTRSARSCSNRRQVAGGSRLPESVGSRGSARRAGRSSTPRSGTAAC